MFRPLPGLTAVSRAHRLLLGVFALSGLISFSWLARIPSVRDALRLTAADLGGILLLGSVGALLTVVSSATLLARFGSARIFGTGAVVMSTGFVLMGTGAGVGARWIFLVGVLLNGIGGALLNVPMNVESARIERAYGQMCIRDSPGGDGGSPDPGRGRPDRNHRRRFGLPDLGRRQRLRVPDHRPVQHLSLIHI